MQGKLTKQFGTPLSFLREPPLFLTNSLFLINFFITPPFCLNFKNKKSSLILGGIKLMSTIIIFGTSKNSLIGLHFWNIFLISDLISLWLNDIIIFQSRVKNDFYQILKRTCKDKKRRQTIPV